ncbi:MAG: DUF4919 domain-containing protein [Mediterranea sp.]|jgi:hypothetical protein|nr:DUF4919 domain-containing protein [Mediterranea sp.]
MKKLLFILTVVLSSAHLTAQESPVNYDDIKTFVTTQPEQFQRLRERFEACDNELTTQDAINLYYGYSFTPLYKGSWDPYQDEYIGHIRNNNLEEARKSLEAALKHAPYSLNILMYLNGVMGKTDPTYDKRYAWQFLQLVQAIKSSGDGKTEDTALKVIYITDEYVILNLFYDMKQLKKQTLTSKQCDLMEFENKKGETHQVYFDISRSMNYLKESMKH